ncbi:hypothetical protein BDD43_5059 [Mucilaginibacter gracilis]|uniref:Outer membrane protein with beta-barrel domain n=1 Tax=Mucilaginibacter gracilis TaxID=423350 RepID=A0A495J731_9SPHI|nr:hypothetical protein [Mucilaginibacter gracilis]RKR84806.1 hypothetical protein BDD43_5059 [Mucilaginibacter gracilis]
MKSIIILLALLALMKLESYAQTVNNILDGIVVKKREKILLRLDSSNKLWYDVSEASLNGGSLNWTPYNDKSYFLIKNNAVNIYVQPVNPLSLGINSEITSRIDEVSSASAAAIATIVSNIKTFAGSSGGTNKQGFIKSLDERTVADVPDCSIKYNNFIELFNATADSLKNNQKSETIKIFTDLKNLTFESKGLTEAVLSPINKKIPVITQHFDNVTALVKRLQDTLAAFECDDAYTSFIFKQVAASTITNIQTELANQVKRLTILKEAADLVNKAYNDAASNQINMLNWFVNIGTPQAVTGTIKDFNLKINKTGYELSPAKEIVTSKTETLATYTISVRKFDWFVPEVWAGVVYSDISYPKYGTATDASGKMTVADGGSDNVSKYSVTTMLNFNLFIANSSIHPFIQAGVGASTDYPALFLGAGLKISDKLSFSVGGASPWVKRLKTLKIGDTVTGTADIDKDTEYAFKGFYRVYYGLQYKL